MFYKKECLLITFLLLPFLIKSQTLPQNQVFNASNEVLIKVFGNDKNYDFRSGKFAGRYHNDQRFFEFYLPILSVYPLSEANEIGIFHDLFLKSSAQPNIHITASFQDPLINVEDFNTPQELVLDGWLSIGGKRYNIPVAMSLFYSNEILYYKMRIELDLFRLNWAMEPHLQKFLTGLVQVQVLDGKWRNFFTQVR